MKILSICIPTYNRATALDRLLECLDKETDGVRDLVEICISDNCSSDETPAIIQKWKKKLPIVYSRNDENVGYDRNVLAATSIASGKYIWFMGDDDSIVDGSVKRLAKDLQANDQEGMNAVYINAFLRKSWITKCGFDGFQVFDKANMPIRPNTSFGGSICLRRETAIKVIKDISIADGMLFKKKYKNYLFHDFVHTFMFMECLEKGTLIGIAPVSGVRIFADSGSVSYRKKLYLELILLNFILEMKLYYPWFRDAELIIDSKMRVIFRNFINNAIACEAKDSIVIYDAFHEALLSILEMEGRGAEIGVLRACDFAGRLPLMRTIKVVKFNLMKRILRLPYENRKETNPILEKNIVYALKSTKALLSETNNPNLIDADSKITNK